jgi:hypothetical protein
MLLQAHSLKEKRGFKKEVGSGIQRLLQHFLFEITPST